ncbi:translation initiation factor IF-1 [bacterium]|nr:translation initiation factor IF-1 [bacterium]
MVREDKVEVQGRVVRALPGGRFLVEVAGKHLLTAHIAGKIRKFFIQVMPGDVVKVEVSVYDKTKGRIVYRFYDENEAKREAQGKRGEDE